MGRMSKVCILGMMIMVALTGCGKEEIVYDEEADTTKQEETVTPPSSTPLRDMLGVGEENVWKEDIAGVNGNIKVSATFDIPDTENLYSMEVNKYYLTAEDKKRIAEYFMDADTIKVDKETMPTKESIQDEIKSYEQSQAEYMAEEGADEEIIAFYQNEKKELEEALTEARSLSEISEEPGDYSEDYYIGTKDGAEITLSFYVDEERNRSAWQMINHSIDFSGHNFLTDQINNCSMTKEEAGQRAVEFCEELGLPAMAPVIIYDLERFLEKGGAEYNGYVVELARGIDGVPADITLYLDDPENEDEEMVLPYSTEQVEIILSDEGILKVFYKGIMTKGDIGEPIKLLSFDQIQEVFRRELETEDMGANDKWEELWLTYMRVADKSNPDKFRYIPVWKLGVYYRNQYMQDVPQNNIFINAIDGTRIDLKDAGRAYYWDEQGKGDYE